MSDNKKPGKNVYLEIGAASLALGAACVYLFPGFGSYLITIFGLWSVVHFCRSWSKFDRIFVATGLGINGAYPIEKRHEKKPGYTLYEFTLPAGLSIEEIQKKQTAIVQWLGKEIVIEYGFKNLLIKVYDEPFRHNYTYETIPSIAPMPILIGYDRTGNTTMVDLSSGEPHMIIAGETGSGKSSALRAIITNIILTKSIDLYLVDLKYGAEFNMFKNCKKVKGFARNRDEAEELFEQVRAEVNRRYDLFSAAGCPDIKAYLAHGNYMRYILLIVDEFADLMQEKKSTRLVEELTSMARACGIHIILSTQRPDAKVLNGRIKSNCAVVLGLKTSTDTNSRIIIDEGGLERLAGKGHGLFKHGGDITEVQVPYLSAERATELVKPYNEIKRKATPADRTVNDVFDEIEGR